MATSLRLACPSHVTRVMSEHRAIGSRHLAFVGVLNALLAHAALLAGDWPDPTLRVGKDEQRPALYLVPGEPTQIIGAGFWGHGARSMTEVSSDRVEYSLVSGRRQIGPTRRDALAVLVETQMGEATRRTEIYEVSPSGSAKDRSSYWRLAIDSRSHAR